MITNNFQIYLEGGPVVGAPSLNSALAAYMDGSGLSSSHLGYVHATSATLTETACYIFGETPEYLAPKGALRFESAQLQYVRVPDKTEYDYINAFTFNEWVRPRTDSNLSYQGIAVKEGVLETWVHPSGNSFGMRARIGGVWYQALTTSFSKNRWYMLTVKHTGTTIHFYLNGNEFHSINAPGSLADNNDYWYFGRYPQYSTYSDIDMTKVQMWNYAMTNAEIAELYTPPARKACLNAYVCIEEPQLVSNTKRCVIVSNSQPDNPFPITSSIGLAFGVNHEVGVKRAFILAGGESVESIDTRIDEDGASYLSLDTLVIVSDGLSNTFELQLGDIEYPITRKAIKYLQIPMKDLPFKGKSYQDAWVQAYHTSEVTRLAYIPAIRYEVGRKSSYIHGFFTALTDTQGAMVVNNSVVPEPQNAYISGVAVFSGTRWKNAYIMSFMDYHTGSKNVFMRGGVTLTPTQRAYVLSPAWLTGRKPAFIMSLADVMESERDCFMRGNVGMERDTSCYINGHYTESPSQDSYVVAVPMIYADKACFMQSENPHKTWKHSFVRGYLGTTAPSQPLFLKAEVNVEESVDGYIRGWRGMLRANRAYVLGPVPTSLNSYKAVFISNNNPKAVLYAFIVSAPFAKQDCYILNTGTLTRARPVYLAA